MHMFSAEIVQGLEHWLGKTGLAKAAEMNKVCKSCQMHYTGGGGSTYIQQTLPYNDTVHASVPLCWQLLDCVETEEQLEVAEGLLVR